MINNFTLDGLENQQKDGNLSVWAFRTISSAMYGSEIPRNTKNKGKE